MGKFTEKLADGRNVLKENYAYVTNPKHGSFIEGKAVDKLAEYEQAEEDGLLKMLPCKVGDVVYKPNPITMKEIVEIEIESIFITASGTNISGRTTKMKYSFCCSPSDFGKTVFLTKA